MNKTVDHDSGFCQFVLNENPPIALHLSQLVCTATTTTSNLADDRENGENNSHLSNSMSSSAKKHKKRKKRKRHNQSNDWLSRTQNKASASAGNIGSQEPDRTQILSTAEEWWLMR